MNADQDEKERIFNAAAELSEQARQAFLDAACGQDSPLRREIEELLQHDEEAGSLLDRAAVAPVEVTSDSKSVTAGIDKQIGPYKLLQEIGEGGFGVVYMAEQQHPIRRQVALKIIKPGMDTREVIARFEAERQALSMMDHPNIARVLDAGTTESGRPYFVMELVKGVPVTKYCDKNTMTLRERLELFTVVCRAIQHAHQKGIIHRDIKPSNVMVTLRDGEPVPKVIDFGISKAINQQLTEKTLFTRYGQMVGTPQYMSPEQAEMSELDVDTRSDIYSLGVLLFELLTGTTPLTAERLRDLGYAEMQRIICEDEVPTPSTRLSSLGDELTIIAKHRHSDPNKLRQQLRSELDWIVMKALDKERSRRYETTSSFAADVEAYLSDDPVLACPPSTGYKLAKTYRKHRRVLNTIVAFFLVLVIATAVSGWQAIVATIARREARAREYGANALLIQASWEQGNISRFRNLLDAQRPDSGEEDYRGFEWHYWWNLHRGEQLQEHTGNVNSVAVSHDGLRLAVGMGTANEAGEIVLCDLATTQKRHFDGFDHRVNDVTFSPDGRLLASASGMHQHGGTVQVWDLETGRELFIQSFKYQANTVAFSSPDGKRLAAGSSVMTGTGGELKVWDWETREEILAFEQEQGFWAVEFHPDGQRIAAGTGLDGSSAAVEIWDVPTGRVQASLPTGTDFVFDVAFSPDGERLAAAASPWSGGDGTVKLWNARTWQELPIPLKGHRSRLVSVCFNHDGSRIGTGAFDNTVKVWDSRSGNELLTFRGHTRSVSSVAFTPDGSRIVSGSSDKTVRFWNAQTSQLAENVHSDKGLSFNSVAFSADGTRITAGTADTQQGSARLVSGKAMVWDIETRNLLFDVAEKMAPVFGVALSRDGKLLATSSGEFEAPGAVQVWDVDKQVQTRVFAGHTTHAAAVAFSPDGTRLASTSGEWGTKAGELKVWNLKSGLEEMTSPKGVYYDASFSPNGRYLAWGKLTLPNGVVDSQSAKLAMAAGLAKGAVTIWDLHQQREAFTLGEHDDAVIGVAFSADGDRLASGSADKTIKIWELKTGSAIRILQGHAGRVHSVAFSPDGKRLVSSGQDETVKLWDLKTGQEVLTFTEHTSFVWAVAFSPDGHRIVSASIDGTVKIWDGEPRG